MDLPGEKLLTRLWDTIERSGTGLLRPWQMKRVGQAESEIASNRILLIAAAEKQAEALRTSGLPELPLLPLSKVGVSDPTATKIDPTFDLTFIAQQSTTSQAIEYLRREVNIEKAISHAENMLQQDNTEPATQAIDMDWFFRWREYSGRMASDTLQQLWGNVLTGEIKAPGSFAYRTLDFLQSLTQEEAKLIERLAATVVDGFGFIHGRSMPLLATKKVSASPLHEGELALLEELGILSGVSALGFVDNHEPHHTADGRHIHIFACNGRGILATTDDPKKKSQLEFYRLTKLGQNILQLVQAAPDEAYLLSLGQLLADDGFKVEIGDVIDIGNGTRGFNNPVTVASPVPETSEST